MPSGDLLQLKEVNYMKSEAAKKASKKYDQHNTKVITLKLNKNTDADILEQLERCENRQGYIKELIRKDIMAGRE